jgi:serine/threonine protein kinase
MKRTSPTTWQRLKWSQQAAEGAAYIHSLGVLHCDINNLLLDKNLNVKLADFQGRHISPDGLTLLDSLSSENVKSSMPRSDVNHADQKTDIFALGSAIYYIITGHERFPELDSFNDDHEVEIASRYRSGQFPHLDSDLGGNVVHECWAGTYTTAGEVVEDLEVLLQRLENRGLYVEAADLKMVGRRGNSSQ